MYILFSGGADGRFGGGDIGAVRVRVYVYVYHVYAYVCLCMCMLECMCVDVGVCSGCVYLHDFGSLLFCTATANFCEVNLSSRVI